MAGNGRLKKILTIENKILLPFVFICVLAVTVLFFALYRFGRTGIVEEMSGIFYRQRYVVLGGIALLLIIVETAVLVSYNIAGPIRKLSEICSGISEAPALTEEENRELSEYAERSDEVGQLAEAFQKMIGSLGDYTRELAFVKNLNENIVENLPLGIVVTDREGKVIFRNGPAAALLYHTEETDASGRNLQDIVDGMLARNDVFPEPARLTDPAGQVRDLEFGSWRLYGHDKTEEQGVLITIDDVTYKRRMEEKASMDEKLAYTGQLAAEMAHEAKNPLAGIRAGLQVTERRLTEDRDRRLCEEMIREVDRVNRLIENMVDLARRRETEKTMVHLNSLFDEVLLLYLKIAENKGILLVSHLSGELWVIADEQELKQILINLINNSLKALTAGGTIRLEADRRPPGVQMAVRDDGPGLDEEKVRKVLSGEEGGLGLSIVRRLAENNGGTFRLESAPGQGTTAAVIFRRGEQERKEGIVS